MEHELENRANTGYETVENQCKQSRQNDNDSCTEKKKVLKKRLTVCRCVPSFFVLHFREMISTLQIHPPLMN